MLQTTLNQFAVALQTECIRRTGMNHVTCLPSDRRRWSAPPMRPGHKLFGQSLNDLAAALYGSSLSEMQIAEAWRQATEIARTSRSRSGYDVQRVIEPLLPNLPFTPPPGHGIAGTLVQFLCAASWSHGRFSASGHGAFLKLGSALLGLDGRSLITGKVRTRFITTMPFARCVVSPMRGRHDAAPETSAVYRHLCTVMPDLADQIDYIVAVAVTARCEATITDLFYIQEMPEPDGDFQGTWEEARKVVERAIENPLRRLYALLGPELGYTAFVKHFGNPHRPARVTYTQRARVRHLQLLDDVQAEQVTVAKLRAAGSKQAEEVNSLLELQRTIGSV